MDRPSVRGPSIAAFVLLFAGLSAQQAGAVEKATPSVPALISADRVSYDDELGLVVANGHVEISQGDRILRADTVTYNQRADAVTASGNVSLLEPTGDVFFANYFELNEGLKNGVAQNFRMLTADKARFAAAGARREGGVLTEMVHGVFSPCELCKEDRERPPLWQLRAARIIHDQDEHQITYEDADLEMFGIPVAYTPYLTYPDPTVKRKTGFLAPSYGHDSVLGGLLVTPYFWNIAPDKDLTVAPLFTTNENPVFAGEYRERWGNAKIDLSGSITDANAFDENGKPKPGTQLRGHVKGTGLWNIDDNWRTGFNAARETDQTYLQRYKIIATSPTVLTTNGYVEGFYGRSYNALNAYAFQDTRQAVSQSVLPIVAPIYQVNYSSEPGAFGQHWSIDANGMNLFRPNGEETRRLSQRTLWELPYISPIGDVYSLSVSLQTDGYQTNSNLNPATPTALPVTSSVSRILPQTRLEWRYPWVRQDGSFQETIEPRIAFMAGARARNGLIPNEDSTDFEFDDENLFRLNPFPGVDRAYGGERFVYGLNLGLYGAKGGSSTLFVGQLYQFKTDHSTFDDSTGLGDNLSDIVGQLRVRPLTFLDFVYRFRLANKDLTPQRTEITMSAGPSYLTAGATYVDLAQEVPGSGLTKITQVTPSLNTAFAQHWSASLYGVRDLRTNVFRNYGANVSYHDECLTAAVTFGKSFTSSRDVHPSTTFLITLIFKDLGDVRIGGS
jgi:LPS-assembly protein